MYINKDKVYLYQPSESNIYYKSDKVTFSLIGFFVFGGILKWKKTDSATIAVKNS